MMQKRAIFLSAGVPDPTAEHFVTEGDTAAISAFISAFLYVALGRRPIVWGGHPAITPMVWAYAEGLGVDYSKWVTLYQSNFFKEDFPEENRRFENVVFTEAFEGDRARSLEVMRRRMLSESRFEAAVFVGGMAGIYDEYRLVKELAKDAKILPIISTGGAAAVLGKDLYDVSETAEDLDYISLLFDRLSIDPAEPRQAPLDDFTIRPSY